MSLPRNTHIGSLARPHVFRRFAPSRLLRFASTADHQHPGPVPEGIPIVRLQKSGDAEGRYAFVNHKLRFIPTSGIRARMERQEKELLEQQQLAMNPTVISSPVVEAEAQDLNLREEDDEVPFESDLSGEGESFVGYKKLARGELVELRASTGLVELAVYLRDSNGGGPTGDFLTTHGMVKRQYAARVPFSIPGFISREDTDKFVDYLTRAEKFEKQRGMSDDQGVAAPLHISAPLLGPVMGFTFRARELLAKRRDQFDALYDQISDETETRRITTRDTAKTIFGVQEPTGEQLYASHLALMGDGLRYLGDKGFHRLTSRFRIRSKRELDMVDAVTQWVRKSQIVFDEKGRGKRATGPLKTFVNKATYLIDLSRRLRNATPDRSGVSAERVDLKEVVWSEGDRKVIEYMISRLKSYGLQHTPIEGLVPYILRQTDRYQECKLDGSAVYDFLTEIGVYSPWENMSLHQENQLLPGYGVSKEADADEARYKTLERKELKDLKLADSLAGSRKDWGNMKVFCVDDHTAVEIDDGISIEKVNDDESWIHIHIANPTAFLTPNHWIAKIAEFRATTKYLDPLTFPMLPAVLGTNLGVASGNAVLTFSTKINRRGEIIDYNIQPGIVHNVQRITYLELDKVLGNEIHPKRIISVGKFPKEHSLDDSGRNLTSEDVDALKRLHECFLNLARRRVRHGMISIMNVMYKYEVAPEATTLFTSADLSSSHPILFRGYPSIKLEVDQVPGLFNSSQLVAEMMILANTITAMYSQKHNLPMPYRTLTYNRERKDVVDYFTDRLMPIRDEFGYSGRSPMEDINVFLHIGFSQLRPEPGPHLLLGLPEGYIKATSPLRRYTDMMVHWNLQAHLSGKPLPFPRTHLQTLLPKVDMAERMANFGSQETRRFWAAACIKRLLEDKKRAEKQLPKYMEMTVTEVKMWPTPSSGFVSELAMMGKVNFRSLKEMANVEMGDKISVKAKEARLGERMVIFESRGLVGKKSWV